MRKGERRKRAQPSCPTTEETRAIGRVCSRRSQCATQNLGKLLWIVSNRGTKAAPVNTSKLSLELTEAALVQIVPQPEQLAQI